MDELDAHLLSDRERIRAGPARDTAQNILRALFNHVRPAIEHLDAELEPGAKLARKLAGSPGNISRRPIISCARAALEGKFKSRYIALPSATTQVERERLLETLEGRAKNPEEFIAGIDFVADGTSEDGIAVYDIASSRLKVNRLHPFIGAFFDDFISESSGLPLEVFAMAEVLLESHLHEEGLSQAQTDSVMSARDQLLRYVAKDSGRMTPLMVANALLNARNDQDQLEIWTVEAFRSLGFEAARIGGKGKPDGVAEALLGPDAKKQPQRYKVSLEANQSEYPR